MPDQTSPAGRGGPGPPDKTWEDGSARRWRPAVQRRVFTTANGLRSVQWGIRDGHGTWHAHPDRLAAFEAAFGEHTAA